MSSGICPKGMWVTEPHAIKKLGLSGKDELKEKLKSGSLSHVLVERGELAKAPEPFSKHRFFFIANAGETASSNVTIQLAQWVNLCQSLQNNSGDISSVDPKAMALLARYSGQPIDPSSFRSLVGDLRREEAIVNPLKLAKLAATDEEAKPGLDGFMQKQQKNGVAKGGSASVGAGGAVEGEIYIRADGKRVRRVKKPAGSSASTVGGSETKSLAGPITRTNSAKTAKTTTTTSGENGTLPPEGEIYIRADGKKVRRVPKRQSERSLGAALNSMSPKPEEGEVYIRADGKKVRRVRKQVSQSSGLGSVKTEGATPASTNGGSGPSGAASVATTPELGEVYIRADGKKVRRVKKPTATNAANTGAKLEGLLGSDGIAKAKAGSGSASVGGDLANPRKFVEGEIYIRPDGKKVRRIKKSSAAAMAGDASAKKGGLEGFLDRNASAQAKGGSATISGDGTASQYKEGEIYIRADGKKVRRVRRVKPSDAASVAGAGSGLASLLERSTSRSKLSGSATVAGDMVVTKFSEGEIYTRPDGKKVRRIKRIIKPGQKKTEETKSAAGDLAGLLEKDQKEAAKKGSGSATVAGETPASGTKPPVEEGEIIIRPDGKKVRRVLKQPPPEEGEVYTRADGKKVRRVRRPKEGTEATESTASPAKNVDDSQETAAEATVPTTSFPSNQPRGAIGVETASTTANTALAVEKPAESEKQQDLQSAQDGPKATEQTPQNAVEDASKPQETSSQVAAEQQPSTGETTDTTQAAPVAVAEQPTPSQPVDEAAPAAAIPESQTKTQEQNPHVQAETTPAAAIPESQTKAQEQNPHVTTGTTDETTGSQSQSTDVRTSQIDDLTPLATPAKLTNEESGTGQFKVMEGESSKVATTPKLPEDGQARYAVKISDLEALKKKEAELKVEADTRYLTLDELANISGQSKLSLEKVVEQKMNLESAVPRFVLQPLEKRMAGSTAPPPDDDATVVSTTSAVTTAPPEKKEPEKKEPENKEPENKEPEKKDNKKDMRAVPKGSKIVPEGMEAVSKDVAEAARAVSAFGGGNDIQGLLDKIRGGDLGDILKKLEEAEKRQKKLEKQLAQAGVAIADDIPYLEAKEKVGEIAKRMGEIGGSDVTHPDKEEQNRLREEYFKLEQEMEKYNSAMMLTEEYQAEQDKIEREWEERNHEPNEKALKAVRRHMPVNIDKMSEAALTQTPSPNGKFLPKAIAKKFKRTNVLMLLRKDPDDIERMHPASLDNMRVTGLTLTERRALYVHLKPCGPKWEKNKSEKMTERKWTWYQMMKNNFKENLAPYERHVKQYGPPENHPYATRDNPNVGCPLIGKQCPIKADKVIDYMAGDYGWTEEAEYQKSDVKKSDVDDPGAKAMAEALELAKEKKANERSNLLKKHYKGILHVSKANGSCENMDESMEKMERYQKGWVENSIRKKDYTEDEKKKEIALFTDALNELKLSTLEICQRSGMQTSGKKKAGGDGPDVRSGLECGLAEEVWETAQEFFKFIKDRMKAMSVKDTRVQKTIEFLEGMLSELHGKNVGTLEKLGEKRAEKSRKLKTTADMENEVRKAIEAEEKEANGGGEEAFDEAPAGPPGGGGMPGGLLAGIQGGRGGRGGLLDGIKGRGGRGGGGGRGGLLDGIKARGGGGDAGGRGGLMAAIQGRGKGGGPPGGDAGGRGGLMAAIQGRGKGGGPPGGDAGGRGGLMAAIQGRGRGGPPGGGRGGLMAAIQARGGGG